jgi:hypothetical protein
MRRRAWRMLERGIEDGKRLAAEIKPKWLRIGG